VSWTGIAPDRLETGGAVEETGRDLVRQGILRLLQTAQGEYLAEPELGNAAYLYLHRPVTPALAVLIAYSCLETLARWEDRVVVDLEADLEPAFLDNGRLVVDVLFVWADTFTPERIQVPLRFGGVSG
jgi:phage baseplate assembly protein W